MFLTFIYNPTSSSICLYSRKMPHIQFSQTSGKSTTIKKQQHRYSRHSKHADLWTILIHHDHKQTFTPICMV